MAYPIKKIEKEFLYTDDSVNVYGFRLLTSGYMIDMFKANPIGFYLHAPEEMPRSEGVLVRWGDISKIIGGGDHTITTLIGSNINDIYKVLYRNGRLISGDEFGLPIYILSPQLIRHIEKYIQHWSLIYRYNEIKTSPYYFVGFYSKSFWGKNQFLSSGIQEPDIKNYFRLMLNWVKSYPYKEDSPELKAFIEFIQMDVIDRKGSPYCPLQGKRMKDRWLYEKHTFGHIL